MKIFRYILNRMIKIMIQNNFLKIFNKFLIKINKKKKNLFSPLN